MPRPKPPPINFIVANLCDNDFGHLLADGLHYGMTEYAYHEKLCPLLWKKYLIAYVISRLLMTSPSIFDGSLRLDLKTVQELENYLQARLQVTFEEHVPEDDHDSGSAYLDVHTEFYTTY